MNPILHDLQNKQWVWTAASAKQQSTKQKLATGFDNLDKVLSHGFPTAGMIHIESPLGCGEMRLMLSVLQHQHKETNTHKLYLFIDPPLILNAEFLLAQNIPLSQLVVVHTQKNDDALWSAEQAAKSGACCAVFMWQRQLKHIHVRKLEQAALKGDCYCVWLDNHALTASSNRYHKEQSNDQSNLPLSLSLSVSRQGDELSITINKQKVGWAQKAIKIPLPFNSRVNSSLKQRKSERINAISKVVPIHANR